MIRGIHGLFYSNKPDELRAFIRDKLALPFTDVHDGWLIFDFKDGDLGIHPTESASSTGKHDISFFTDDLAGTVKELSARGVVFDDEITNRGYGLVTHFTMPGNVKVQLYQPRYRKNPRPAPPAKTAARTKTARTEKRPAKKGAAAKTSIAKRAAAKKSPGLPSAARPAAKKRAGARK